MGEKHESRYYSIQPDLFDKLYRYYSLIIAITLVGYAILVYNHSAKEHSVPFFFITFCYAILNLTIGIIIFLRQESLIRYNTRIFQHIKFFSHFMICSLLLYIGNGSYFFYLLYFTWLLSYNKYFTQWNYKLFTSSLLGLGIALIFLLINLSQIGPTFIHKISMVLKATSLVIGSPMSYLFWKNRQQLKKYSDSLRIVEIVSTKTTSALTAEKTLNNIATEAIKIFNADLVQIKLIEPNENKKRIYISISQGRLIEPRYKKKDEEHDEVTLGLLRNNENIYENDAQNNKLLNKKLRTSNSGFLKRENIKSVAAVLLKNNSHALGVMTLNFRTHQSFSSNEIQSINMFANLVTLAVKNLNEKDLLIEKVFESIRELNSVKKLLYETLVSWEKKITKKLLNQCQELLQEELAYYASINDDHTILTIENVSKKYQGFKHKKIKVDSRGGLCIQAVLLKKHQIMFSRKVNTRGWKSLGEFDKKVKSAMAIPIEVNKVVRGVLFFESENDYRFSNLSAGIVKLLIDNVAYRIYQQVLLEEKFETKILNDFLAFVANKIAKDSEGSNLLEDILNFLLIELGANNCKILLKKGRTFETIISTKGFVSSEEMLVDDKTLEKFLLIEDIYVNNNVSLPKNNTYTFTDDKIDQEMRSLLILNLKIHDEVYGILYAESNDKDCFNIEKQKKAIAIQPYITMTVKKANLINRINKQSEELKVSNNLLKISERDAQHRLRNYLAEVIDLLNLELISAKREEGANNRTSTILQDTILRIDLILELHYRLLKTERRNVVDAEQYFFRIIEAFEKAYQRNIKIEKNIDSIMLMSRTANYIGLIINELLTNAIKYAFPNDREGYIQVSFTYDENKHVLIIQDNGVGIEEYNKDKKSSKTGMKIIDMMVEQLDAELKFDQTNGTIARLIIPRTKTK